MGFFTSKNRPTHIIIHHTAVSREKNAVQFQAVKNYHISKGWGDIGYHYFIGPDGTVKVGRTEETPGAHCYQESMNYKSIGICLTGFFDVEDPTERQLESLKKLVQKLRVKYGISASNVVGHRHFAPKTCPGTRFTDKMIEEVANDEVVESPTVEQDQEPSEWAEDAWEWVKSVSWYDPKTKKDMKGLITKDPKRPRTGQEIALILYRFANRK